MNGYYYMQTKTGIISVASKGFVPLLALQNPPPFTLLCVLGDWSFGQVSGLTYTWVWPTWVVASDFKAERGVLGNFFTRLPSHHINLSWCIPLVLYKRPQSYQMDTFIQLLFFRLSSCNSSSLWLDLGQFSLNLALISINNTFTGFKISECATYFLLKTCFSNFN